MAKSLAKRVSVIEVGANGSVATIELTRSGRGKKKKKKKIPQWAKPLEKGHRHALRALQVYANRALDLHARSNRKKRNGWLVDALDNHYRAGKRAEKQLDKIPVEIFP